MGRKRLGGRSGLFVAGVLGVLTLGALVPPDAGAVGVYATNSSEARVSAFSIGPAARLLRSRVTRRCSA